MEMRPKPLTPEPSSDRHGRSLALLLSGLLYLLEPEKSAAEGGLHYKYQDYKEGAGRVQVLSHYLLAEGEIAAATRLKAVGLVDAISGASPTGQPAPPGSSQVPLSELRDERRASIFDLTHQWEAHRATLQFAYSKESDYRSRSLALTDVVEFNRKSTTLQVGFSQVEDEVFPRFFEAAREKKGNDFLLGGTQLLDHVTVLTANVTYGNVRGYLSDPYKIVQKRTEVFPGVFLPRTFPENRPAEREKLILFSGVTRFFEQMNGSLDTSYRYLQDGDGIRSHTLDFEWNQKLGSRWVIRPSFRFYDQSEADYYYASLEETAIQPSRAASGTAPYYSSDYRLSQLRAYTYGLKVVWFLREGISVDAAYERYEMNGRDGVTPASAYPSANILTVGAHLWF